MASKRGTMVFNRKFKMLVLFLVLNIADFCQSKAFLEDEKTRGKRFYSYDQSVGLHQTYDPQVNTEHWMTGNFYQPQVDGQPIYVPALDQPGSYNEFLDNYYKTYTPAWNLATPAPPTYRTKSGYENSEISSDVLKGLLNKKDGVDYIFPTSEESLKIESIPSDFDSTESKDYDDSDSNDYDALEIEKIRATEFTNKNFNLLIPELKNRDEFEEPILRESLKKKAGSSKTEPVSYVYDEPVIVKTVKQKPETHAKKDVYDEPVIAKTVKQKPEIHIKKDAYKKPSAPIPKPQLENTEDYEKPVVHKTVKIKPSKKPITDQIPKYYQTTQTTLGKSKGKRRKQYSKSNKPRTTEEYNESQFDPNTIAESSDELSKKEKGQYPPHGKPLKEVIVKSDSKKPEETKQKVVVKTKEKVIVKPDSEDKPIKMKPKGKPVKTHTKDKPIKIKEKVVVKTNTKDKPVKIKEKVVVTSPQYHPGNTNGNESLKSYPTDKPEKKKENVSVKYTGELETKEIYFKKLSDQNDEDSEGNDMGFINTLSTLEDKSDLADDVDMTERQFPENKLNSEHVKIENIHNSGNSESSTTEKSDSVFPNTNDFRGLSSMNSNIWSMLFNPNAEKNRLKLKRCITRSNETGFCTYIQNCEVPHIANSLEQLLNNACVIDDIFIGVCCPEFPVETVKVHWDQTVSDFDSQVEDEFGHNAEDCGIRSNEAVDKQSWPWKAPLVSMSNGKIFCGGVLVSEDHVLTAAHCTTKIPKNQILVRLGQYDESSGDDYAVVEIKRHAQYNSRTMHNDIALLKLGRRIMNDAHIGIACLPDDDGDHEGETATLLGWRGIFGTKSREPEFLKVITNKECENKLGMKVPSTLLCTETRKESGRTCNADSGAPIVIEDDGKYEVIGILAWNRNDCNQRFPSTFSRVSSYTGWIKKHIE